MVTGQARPHMTPRDFEDLKLAEEIAYACYQVGGARASSRVELLLRPPCAELRADRDWPGGRDHSLLDRAAVRGASAPLSGWSCAVRVVALTGAT